MSLPRYPDYRDSGADWLGFIPAHWCVQPLKHGADFVNGCAFKPEQWEENGTPIIRIENLNGSLSFNYVTGDVDARYHVGEGDLLFGWSGNRGTSFGPFLWPHAGKHYLNQHIFRICNFKFFKSWFYWTLKAVTSHVEDQAHGIIGMVHVTKGELGAIKVPVPPIAEQTAIATFLDRETWKIDALIAEQEKLLALLTEKRQATISHAVTKGLNPKAAMKDSCVAWLGEVPEHWETIRLGALFREVSEPGNEELPVLSVSIHDGVSDKELDEKEMDRKVTRSDDRSKYKAVSPGDLTYNMMRAWQGGFGSVLVEGMVSPAYVVARPTREFSTSLIEQQLRTPKAVTEIKRHSRGITDFRLRLYWEEFKTIYVALPPKSEQDEILLFIESESFRMNALADEANHSIALLKERRSALITAAVTGQIDVRKAIQC